MKKFVLSILFSLILVQPTFAIQWEQILSSFNPETSGQERILGRGIVPMTLSLSSTNETCNNLLLNSNLEDWEAWRLNPFFLQPTNWYWSSMTSTDKPYFDNSTSSAHSPIYSGLMNIPGDIGEIPIVVAQGHFTTSTENYGINLWHYKMDSGLPFTCFALVNQKSLDDLLGLDPADVHFWDFSNVQWTDMNSSDFGANGIKCYSPNDALIWEQIIYNHKIVGNDETDYLWLIGTGSTPSANFRVDDVNFCQWQIDTSTPSSSIFATNTSALLDYAVTEHGSAMLWIAGGLLSFAFLAMILRVFAGLKNNV